MTKSLTISRIAFGVGLFAICGPAFAGLGDFIQLAGAVASFAFPQYAFAIALVTPAVGTSFARRKVRGDDESR